MKNILVGLDHTGTDAGILEVAVPLAKGLGAKLHLLHVQRELSEWVEYSMISIRHDPEERRQLTAANGAKINESESSVREAGVAVEGTVVEGDPLERLLELAGEKSCELIVVGSHGRNMVERAILGHVADRIVRKSPVPVLVVPTVR